MNQEAFHVRLELDRAARPRKPAATKQHAWKMKAAPLEWKWFFNSPTIIDPN
jgi:hypothetical protein